MYFLYSVLLGIVVVVSILGLSLLALTAYIYYIRYPLRHIPCPPMSNYILGHIGDILDYTRKEQILGDAVLDWSETCGDIFRIHSLWINTIIILRSSAVKEILITSNWPKYSWTYRHYHSIFGARFAGNGLLTEVRMDRWAKNRALFNQSFHRSYLKTCIDQYNISSNLLLNELSSKCDGSTEVMMLEEFNKVGLDIMAKVAFGTDFGIYDGNSKPFMEAIKFALSATGEQFRRPWRSVSPFARDYRKKVDKCCRFIRETGRQCIQRQKDIIDNGEHESANIIAHILKTSSESSDDMPAMEEMVDEFVTFFFAGQETTANFLAWTLMELIHNPEVLYRLKAEVKAVLGDKEDIAFEDLSKLEYMMAVFKEALRLHPPIMGSARMAPNDYNFDGVNIPKGTNNVVMIYTMSRMEKYFQDPLTFDPDRFLNNDTKRTHAYFPFSLGPRTCIGQQFALIEARVILSKLIRDFEFTWVQGQSMGTALDATIKPKGGCKCYITRTS